MKTALIVVIILVLIIGAAFWYMKYLVDNTESINGNKKHRAMMERVREIRAAEEVGKEGS